ncbi:MAG TPA: hypothetical protein VFU73_07260, partial [Actinocrinis sp.]|nr:hypothetical protein [Actinocrinis sp.]
RVGLGGGWAVGAARAAGGGRRAAGGGRRAAGGGRRAAGGGRRRVSDPCRAVPWRAGSSMERRTLIGQK